MSFVSRTASSQDELRLRKITFHYVGSQSYPGGVHFTYPVTSASPLHRLAANVSRGLAIIVHNEADTNEPSGSNPSLQLVGHRSRRIGILVGGKEYAHTLQDADAQQGVLHSVFTAPLLVGAKDEDVKEPLTEELHEAQEALRTATQEHEEQVRQLDEAHNTAIGALREELATAQDGTTEAQEALRQANQTHAQQVRELDEAHETAIDALREELAAVREELRQARLRIQEFEIPDPVPEPINDPVPERRIVPVEPVRKINWPKWIAIGGTTATIGIGLAYLSLSNNNPSQMPTNFTNSTNAITVYNPSYCDSLMQASRAVIKYAPLAFEEIAKRAIKYLTPLIARLLPDAGIDYEAHIYHIIGASFLE